MRLFGGEGVSAVSFEAEAVKAEVGGDGARGADRLVGEDGHGERRVALADGAHRLKDAGVDVGVVQLVKAIPFDEPEESLFYEGIVVGVWLVGDEMGVGKGAADEGGGSIADVGGDDVLCEGRFAEVAQHGVDGVREVNAGVYEGAVQVKDEEAGGEEHGSILEDWLETGPRGQKKCAAEAETLGSAFWSDARLVGEG